MLSVIQFANKNNDILRGVLHCPESSFRQGKKDLIIFPNGGLMGCEGDFRAHVRIANYLTGAGFYILRFSPSGLGYSDGHIAESNIRDLFGKLEKGLFINDIKTAVEFSQKKYKPDSIILSGICGGAISSFLAAAEIDFIKHVVPIGIPVVLDSSQNVDNQRMAKEQAKNIILTYIHKIFSVESWLRLLSLKSDFITIKTAFIKIFERAPSKDTLTSEQLKYRINEYFFNAAELIFKRKKKVLFIFGDSDRFWWEFENLYVKQIYSDKCVLPFDRYLVANGNHMLTFVEMQMEAAEKILQWLKANLNKFESERAS